MDSQRNMGMASYGPDAPPDQPKVGMAMRCYLVKFDDSTGINLFADNEQDALAKAQDRRLNPNSTAMLVEEL